MIKFILNHQIDIFILINYNYGKRGKSNNGGYEVTKEIVKVTKANDSKKKYNENMDLKIS